MHEERFDAVKRAAFSLKPTSLTSDTISIAGFVYRVRYCFSRFWARSKASGIDDYKPNDMWYLASDARLAL